MNDKVNVSIDCFNLGISLPFFVFLIFFWRGCGQPQASIYDEYMKAKHNHVVRGLVYDEVIK